MATDLAILQRAIAGAAHNQPDEWKRNRAKLWLRDLSISPARVADRISELSNGDHILGWNVLCSLWVLRHVEPGLAARLLTNIEPRTWIERYEWTTWGARLGVGRVYDNACYLDCARPAWVDPDLPFVLREPLAGALMPQALGFDHDDIFTPVWPDELPPGWVLVGGFDRFEVVNDRFGRYEGDRALQRLLDRLMSVAGDRVIRLGGDEVLVLYEHDDGPAFADLLRQQLTVRWPAGDLVLTISFGVARSGPTPASLRRARHALLEAKRLGRNRVVHALD